jgi:hypothetical protein
MAVETGMAASPPSRMLALRMNPGRLLLELEGRFSSPTAF